MDITNLDIRWDDELENLIKDECEVCYSYYLLHNLSYLRYSKLNNYINVPSMIIGTFTGATSMGSQSLFGGSSLASVFIGVIIILLNSLQAINTYFKFSQLSEAHKIASISFQKISRYLEIELTLPRRERSIPKVIMKILKNEIDRLMETSPIIQPYIIKQYNKLYGNEKAKKPAIVNGLKIVVINDNKLTLDSKADKITFKTKNNDHIPLNINSTPITTNSTPINTNSTPNINAITNVNVISENNTPETSPIINQ
jgi:hypothetical protein